jgi:hypothetical protein
MYTQRSPAGIQIPTHWNLIGRSMTAPPPVLTPNSILPPLSSHCAHFKNIIFYFKNVVSLELHNSGSVRTRKQQYTTKPRKLNADF